MRAREEEKSCPAGGGPGAVGLARASDAELAARAGGRGVRAGGRQARRTQAGEHVHVPRCCEGVAYLIGAIGVLPSHGRSACGTRTCADQDKKRMKSNKNIRAGECISRSKRSSGLKLSYEWNASAHNLILALVVEEAKN